MSERLVLEGRGPEEVLATSLLHQVKTLAQETEGGWRTLAEEKKQRRQIADQAFGRLFLETKGDFGLMKQSLSLAFKQLDLADETSEQACRQVLFSIGGLTEYHLNLAALASQRRLPLEKTDLGAAQLAQARKSVEDKLEVSLGKKRERMERVMSLLSRLPLAREKLEEKIESLPTARQKLIQKAVEQERKLIDQTLGRRTQELAQETGQIFRPATHRWLLKQMERRAFLKKTAIAAAVGVTGLLGASWALEPGRLERFEEEIAAFSTKRMAKAAEPQVPSVVFTPKAERTPRPAVSTLTPDFGSLPLDAVATNTPPARVEPTVTPVAKVAKAPVGSERPILIKKVTPESEKMTDPLYLQNPEGTGAIDFANSEKPIIFSFDGRKYEVISFSYGEKGRKEFDDIFSQVTEEVKDRILVYLDKETGRLVALFHSGTMRFQGEWHRFPGEVIREVAQGPKGEKAFNTKELEDQGLRNLVGMVVSFQQEGMPVNFGIEEAVLLDKEEVLELQADEGNVSRWLKGKMGGNDLILRTCANLLEFDKDFVEGSLDNYSAKKLILRLRPVESSEADLAMAN